MPFIEEHLLVHSAPPPMLVHRLFTEHKLDFHGEQWTSYSMTAVTKVAPHF